MKILLIPTFMSILSVSCSFYGDKFPKNGGSSGNGNAGSVPTLMGGAVQTPLVLSNIVSTAFGPAQGSITAGDTDGLGNAARFNVPRGITTDGTNLYVIDGSNNKIRQIVISTGSVTTIAGPAQGCYNTCPIGDTDGIGTAARFSGAVAITTDGTNLFVAESGNNKIRQIVIATGLVTTLAGPTSGSTASGDTDATGNAARFLNPSGITTDGTNLYVADYNNNKIRKIVISTRVVTTIAGPAQGTTTAGDTDAIGNAARFYGPAGITTDGINLFVAETLNRKIRKIVLATGAVTTLAGPAQGCYNTCTSSDVDGTGNAALFGPVSGLTMDGLSLYIPDGGWNKIRKAIISTAAVSTPIGPAQGTSTTGDTDGTGNAARFSAPQSVTTDGTSLFISDRDNNKIRRVQ